MKKAVVFKFDPYSTVFLCFREMFPKKQAQIEWSDNLQTDDAAWGKTNILNKGPASVLIDASQSVNGSIDTLIHELAHVGRGYPSNKTSHHKTFVMSGGHDQKWLNIYNDLWKSYEKHHLTYLFLLKIGMPKGMSEKELFGLTSAIVEKSFKNQLVKKRRKKNGTIKTPSR